MYSNTCGVQKRGVRREGTETWIKKPWYKNVGSERSYRNMGTETRGKKTRAQKHGYRNMGTELLVQKRGIQKRGYREMRKKKDT